MENGDILLADEEKSKNFPKAIQDLLADKQLSLLLRGIVLDIFEAVFQKNGKIFLKKVKESVKA